MAQRKNYHTVRYGTKDGEIKFGHIHEDNNESAVMFRSGSEWLHYITMDHTGEKGVRKNSTICRSKGPFKVEAGDECIVTPDNAENQVGIQMLAASGDIVLFAPKGKIKIQAQDIELITRGGTGKTGVIKLDSNEKVIVDSKSIAMNATESYKIFSEKTMDMVGNAIMNVYGGLMDFADGATKLKGSKCGPSSTEENAKKFKAEAASQAEDQAAAEAEQAQFEADQAGGT